MKKLFNLFFRRKDKHYPMDKFSRLYTLVITNKSDKTVDVTILNPWGGFEPSFPDGVEVVLRQSDYRMLLIETVQIPKLIRGIKVQVKDQNQLDNEWKVGSKNAGGKWKESKYSPYENLNSYQNIPNRFEDPGFEFDLNVSSYLTIPVNGTNFVTGGERIVLQMYAEYDFNPSRIISGKPYVSKSVSGYKSGLPNQEIRIGNPNPSSFFKRLELKIQLAWTSVSRLWKKKK